jgi:hypothetical protein
VIPPRQVAADVACGYNDLMKRLVFLVFLVFLFVRYLSDASAAMLTFTHDGEVYWNVLGLTDSSIQVKKIADSLTTGTGTSVSLVNDNGKVFLDYDGEKQVDITGYRDDIVVVEEKGSATLRINATQDGLSIAQGGVTVNTSFPINVNSQKNRLSVETSTGEIFLAVLPHEAITQIIRTRIIDRLLDNTLAEKPEGEVVYLVRGEKEIELFNIFSFSVPVAVEVSAVSGSVVKIDQPLWYSMLDFLFV